MVYAQCVIGRGKYPVAGMDCKNAIDKKSEAFADFFSCSGHLLKKIVLQKYITQKHFITSNKYQENNCGYGYFVFDIRHHQDFTCAQPKKVRLNFISLVEAAINLIG